MLPFWTPILASTQVDLSAGIHTIARRGMEAAITIKASDRVIDLANFELRGSTSKQQERYTGVGLLLEHCQNLTLKGGNVHGYKINVLLRSCKNVRIENMRADSSHADPIRSRTGQPIDRFLNLRNVDEWVTYGSGFWLHDCDSCHLVKCSAHHAMNGAILVTSSDCTLYDCDFSYNSAWGVGLWASESNRILWNHVDFCNRPWSGGWGGDAANLAVVNNSNKNLIVGNSLTHGGDGFFLADRVEGGWNEQDKHFHFQDDSNGNLVWNNDGSWASANAFEATFSANNSFGENEANDSTYGFWLGYSNHSLISSNRISRNEHDGVAIEHGQSNRILSNIFDSDREAAIHLWSTPGPKDVDKPSADNVVAYNKISNCGVALDLKGSARTTLIGNDGEPNEGDISLKPTWTPPSSVSKALALKPSHWKSYRDSGGPTGQAWIQLGAYAPVPFVNYGSAYVNPYTYKLWFAHPPTNVTAPPWLTLKPGHDARYLTATAKLDSAAEGSDLDAVVSFDTIAPVAASFQTGARSELTLHFRSGSWDCKWFSWKSLTYDDRSGWLHLFNSKPLARQTLPILNEDYSGRSPVPGVVPVDHFALLATRRFQFSAGIYRFSSVSDDGIRLFVDGREIISRWNHHGGTADSVEVSLSKGVHDLKVEYCQEDGGAQIKVDWTKVRSAPRL